MSASYAQVALYDDPDAWYGRPLSPREWQVLWAVACGWTNRQMAAKLGISHETVKNHLTRIMAKLGAHDRTHALVLAITTRPALGELPTRGRGLGLWYAPLLTDAQLARAVALRRQGITYDQIGVELAVSTSAVRQAIVAAIGVTPSAYRITPQLAAQMVALRRQGWSYRRIAAVSACSAPTATQHVQRALGWTSPAKRVGGFRPINLRTWHR
jgi:DNA-binding CsgD family transcriptional regulator